MNELINNKKVINIDLKEVIWKLLSQWKAILLVSIIMAMLACGLKHISDVKSYNEKLTLDSEAAQLASLSADERIAMIIETIPEDERSAVEHILREKKWIDEQKDYLQKSIIMQNDPTRQRILMVLFDIGAATERNTEVLKRSFMMYAYDEDFIGELKKVIDPDTEDKYIEELVDFDSTDDSTNSEENYKGTVLIRTILPEDADAESVINVIKSEIENHSRKMQADYTHTITFVEAEDMFFYNASAVNIKQSLNNNINNLETNIKNTQSSLSNTQKEAITAITAINKAAAVIDSIEENPDKEREAVGGNTEDNENELTAPGYSKRIALLGFIFGIFMYAFIYVAWLILRGRINSATSAQGYIGSRLLGEIYYDNEPFGLARLFHSKFVEKYHYRGRNDRDSQIERITDSLEAVCIHAEADSITMISMICPDRADGQLKEEKGILDSVIRESVKKGLEVDFIEMTKPDDFDEKEMLNINNAVLVVGADTKVNSLEMFTSLCSEYGVKTIGSVYVAQM